MSTKKTRPRRHPAKAKAKARPKAKVTHRRHTALPPKAAPKVASNPVQGEVVGKTVPTSTLKFASRSHRTSKWAALAKIVSALKEGDSHVLPIPKGVSRKVFHNKVHTGLLRNAPQMAEGLMYIKRTVVDKDDKPVAISIDVVTVKGAKTKAMKVLKGLKAE